MSNIQIETDLKEILNKLDGKIDNLQKDLTELKVSQIELKGDIKRLDSNISNLKEDKYLGKINCIFCSKIFEDIFDILN